MRMNEIEEREIEKMERVVGNSKCCFTCGKSGHFSSVCPERSAGWGKKRGRGRVAPLSDPPQKVTSTAEFSTTHCLCGGGLCEIKESSKNGRRAFYTCPGKYEMKCNYFKWCNELKKHEIVKSQPWPYPICSCKAGVCRLETLRNGPNSNDRKYFARRVKKGDGACNFRQWYDDYVEIASISAALETGDMDLDFPTEKSADEIEINDFGQEILDLILDELPFIDFDDKDWV